MDFTSNILIKVSKKPPNPKVGKKVWQKKAPKFLRNLNHDINNPLENPKGCFFLFLYLQFFVFHFFHYWYA